ncbi:peptidase associated/transthyretin-like domain-containing protein [Flavobacterium luteum]|uniref:Carboxypeptidase-like regulatory domain-containing protein n=1 Tax=Flavobacterium luteum TaxID=2026654 RepID=A0A7J5AGI3_9FLAO|nr:carboxypeptidase-like regulatory domain-containing protein [Flavobacterium luteum]KAB1156716.1 carboxypeptidase-like regulatory domain-containing protein [Flavobacterium luteum]
MKSKIGILAFFLFGQICLGQIGTRKLIHGQVVNDSINVENVVVFNANSKTGTVTSNQGYFSIYVMQSDTLVFSGLQFKSKKIIYSEIKGSEIKVKLEAFSYQLSEVVVFKEKKTKPIASSQAIIDKKYFDDEKSSPKNKAMIPVNVLENPMDFVRIYKDVFKILKINTPKILDFTTKTDFTELVMKKIDYSFFNNTLKLKDDEIKLFLVYCENDPKSSVLLKSNTKFELMDFLIEKNIEFKKIANFEK